MVRGYTVTGGEILSYRLRPAERVGWYVRIIKAARPLGYEDIEQRALGTLVAAFGQDGKADDARRVARQSVRLACQQNDMESVAATLTSLGIIERDQGQTSKALRYLERASKIAKHLGYPRAEGRAIGMIVSIFKLQGRVAEAKEMQERRIELARSCGDVRAEGIALANIIELRERAVDKREALEAAQKAVRILSDHADPYAETVQKWLHERTDMSI